MVLRADGADVALPAHKDYQDLLESKGFEVKRDLMAFQDSQVHRYVGNKPLVLFIYIQSTVVTNQTLLLHLHPKWL